MREIFSFFFQSRCISKSPHVIYVFVHRMQCIKSSSTNNSIMDRGSKAHHTSYRLQDSRKTVVSRPTNSRPHHMGQHRGLIYQRTHWRNWSQFTYHRKAQPIQFPLKEVCQAHKTDLVLIPSSFFQLFKKVSKSIFQVQKALLKPREHMIWQSFLLLMKPIDLPQAFQNWETCSSHLNHNMINPVKRCSRHLKIINPWLQQLESVSNLKCN